MDFLKFENAVKSFISSKNKTEKERQTLIEYGVKLKATKDTSFWKNGCQAIIEQLCKIAVGSQGVDHARTVGRSIQHWVEQGLEVEDQRKLFNSDGTIGKIPDLIMVKKHEGFYITHEIIIEVETRDSIVKDEAEKQIEVFQSYARSSSLADINVVIALPDGHIVKPPVKAAQKADAIFMESGYGLSSFGSPLYFSSKELPR